MKKVLSLLLSLVMLMSVATAIPATAQAQSDTIKVSALTASKKATNKKAKKLYNKKVKKIRKKGWGPTYKYCDMNGDGIVELILYYHIGKDGSGCDFQIYTYKKGKMKAMLKTLDYGIETITVYKKSKSFVTYNCGHGYESYTHYKLTGGKYEAVYNRGRMAIAAGNDTDEEWYYYSNDAQLDVSQYNKLVKPLEKGKAKKVSLV